MSTDTARWRDMIVAPKNYHASQRTRGMTTGKTAQSAYIADDNITANQRDRNRREALIPDNWAALTPEQMQARRERILGNVPAPTRDRVARVTVTRRSRDELVAHWIVRARNAPNPARFIVNSVPPQFQADVVAAAM